MSVQSHPGFDNVYAALSKTGEIDLIDGGQAFWSNMDQLARVGEGWLVTEFEFISDWSNWEMHPAADEIVYLLSGEVDLLLEKDRDRQTARLTGKGFVVVPRGTWHTAKIIKPGRMLVITLGRGTEQRPA